MEKKYFWREKNADACMGKGKVFEPTREELKAELVAKLRQKLDRVDVIFDKAARKNYWETDEKSKSFNLEDFSEEELQRKIGLNVVVDFLQLTRDLCQFYEIELRRQNPNKLSVEDIKKQYEINIKSLDDESEIQSSVENILRTTISLMNLLGLAFEDVEQKRKEKEEKQGSFYKGKYVIIDLKK